MWPFDSASNHWEFKSANIQLHFYAKHQELYKLCCGLVAAQRLVKISWHDARPGLSSRHSAMWLNSPSLSISCIQAILVCLPFEHQRLIKT